MPDDEVSLEELLGSVADTADKDKPADATDKPADATPAFTIPDTADVPQELRGMSLKDALSKYQTLNTQLNRVSQERADLARSLESAARASSGTPAPNPAPAPAEPTAVLAQNLVQMKLDKVFSASPDLKPYSDELLALINSVPEVYLRPNDEAINTAVAIVRGRHFDDLVSAARAAAAQTATPSPTVTGAATAPVPSVTGESIERLGLSPEQIRNLRLTYGNNMEAVRDLLKGGE